MKVSLSSSNGRQGTWRKYGESFVEACILSIVPFVGGSNLLRHVYEVSVSRTAQNYQKYMQGIATFIGPEITLMHNNARLRRDSSYRLP